VNDPKASIKPSIECAKFIKDTLSSWNIESRIIELDGYFSVFGSVGKGVPKVMFLAHYDTVPVNLEEWNTDPFKLVIKNGKGYGRGAADDKSNVASIMMALKELNEKNDIGGRILFAFTGDEEIGGTHGAGYIVKSLQRSGLLPQYLINGDGFGMTVIIRRRAVFKAEIRINKKVRKVKGKVRRVVFEASTPISSTRHAAYFMPGVDTHPLIAASHYLRSNPDIYVSNVSGIFIKSNVIPSKVSLEVVEPGEGKLIEVDESLTNLIRSIVPLVRVSIPTDMYSDYGVSITPNIYSIKEGQHIIVLDIRAMLKDTRPLFDALRTAIDVNELNAELMVAGTPQYLNTSIDSEIVKLAMETLEELNERPRVTEGAGASDSRFFSPLNIETIDIGPRGGNIHGPNEYIELYSLKKMPKFYESIALKLLKNI
jgi:succinyl-diaminopimelate desuccinylase